jgi:D-serine deaminase-like pyridoxal phosphate-dependent protein
MAFVSAVKKAGVHLPAASGGGTPRMRGTRRGGLPVDDRDAMIEPLNEGHGMVDLRRREVTLSLGDRGQILSNHVCVVTNLHNEVVVSRNGQVESIWPIAARGLTR